MSSVVLSNKYASSLIPCDKRHAFSSTEWYIGVFRVLSDRFICVFCNIELQICVFSSTK